MATLNTFHKILKRNNFIPIMPPRSDIKPGFIINPKSQIIIATDKHCFPSRQVPKKSANVTIEELLRTTDTTYTVDIETALSQIAGSIYIPTRIESKLEHAIKKKVDLEHKGFKSEYIADQDVLERMLTFRTNDACYISLSRKNVIVIIEALKVNQLSYTFKKKGRLQFDVALDWLKNIISARGRIDRETKEYFTFTIKEPRCIAYRCSECNPRSVQKLAAASIPPLDTDTGAAVAPTSTARGHRRPAALGAPSPTGGVTARLQTSARRSGVAPSSAARSHRRSAALGTPSPTGGVTARLQTSARRSGVAPYLQLVVTVVLQL
ncbi:MAG: hypothetical protein ACUZ8A_08700 [Candidatus Bathyanammoxibius sp.]